MPRYIMETGKLSMVPPLKGASHWQQHAGQCRQTANEVKKRGLPGRVRLEYVKNLVRFSLLRGCGSYDFSVVRSDALRNACHARSGRSARRQIGSQRIGRENRDTGRDFHSSHRRMGRRDTDRVQGKDKERRRYMGSHTQAGVEEQHIVLVVQHTAAAYTALRGVPRVG